MENHLSESPKASSTPKAAEVKAAAPKHGPLKAAFGTNSIIGSSIGFPGAFGQHVRNLQPNAQGDSVVVTPSAGNALVCVIFGLSTLSPFDNLHAGYSVTPAKWMAGLTDFLAAPVVTDTASDVSTITNSLQVDTTFTLTNAAAAVSGSTTYTGTITGGATNAFAGYTFVIAGFTNAGNNGTFVCTASTVSTLVLTNAGGVLEAHAGTANDFVVTLTAANNFAVGDTVVLAGLTTATWLNGQTITVVTVSGTQFTFSDLASHAASLTHSDTGTATRTSGNDWVMAAGSVVRGDYDYSGIGSSLVSLDGYYPSIYIFYALNVTGGTYRVNVNSCFQGGVTRPQQLAAGKPIFNGGVNAMVFEVANVVTTAASDGSTGGMSAANPAIAPSITTGTSGDMLITAGLMKSGNVFSTNAPAGTTGTQFISQGKCVGSEAHWAVQVQLQTSSGAITPGFTNPLGYEMAVVSLALKHS